MKHLEMKISAEFMIKRECQVTINSKQAKEDHLVVAKEAFLVLKASMINSVKEVVLRGNKEVKTLSETFLRSLRSSSELVAGLADKLVALSVDNNKLKAKTLW